VKWLRTAVLVGHNFQPAASLPSFDVAIEGRNIEMQKFANFLRPSRPHLGGSDQNILLTHFQVERPQSVVMTLCLSLLTVASSAFAALSPRTIIVAHEGSRSITAVDPLTGNRTIVSGGGIGAGIPLRDPAAFTINCDGEAFVGDAINDALLAVDVATGDRVFVSGPERGVGPKIESPTGIAIDAAGDFLVIDAFASSVLSVDSATGNRVVLSSNSVGSGVGLCGPDDIAIDVSGNLLIVDRILSALFVVDADTGFRTILSATPNPIFGAPAYDVGTGVPNWAIPIGVFVLPFAIPEPSSLLLVLGAAFTLGRRRGRQ
jgi:hypothetical protein